MVDVLVFHEVVGQPPRMRPMRIWRWSHSIQLHKNPYRP